MAEHRLRAHLPERGLAGVQAKMDRADECLNTLHYEFQAFANSNPITVNFEFDLKSEWHTAHVEYSPPPIRLGVLAGESLYHARSSLEHLVWALVKANKKRPGQHNTFPIRTKPYKDPFWKVTRTSSLKGVPKAARTLIEELQPYQGPPSNVSDHWLAILDAMAKADRHHTLHTTIAWMDVQQFKPLFVANGRAQIVDFRTLARSSKHPLVNGAKIAKLRIKPIGRQAKVHVKGNLPVDIGFGDPEGVLAFSDLRQLISDVRKAFRLFEKFF